MLEESPAGKCLNERVNNMDEAPGSGPANTDEDLVRLVIAGERDLFAPIYERYYWRVFRMAYGMTGNHGSAEDLTQEIFMRAYQRLKEFRGESAFSTWLYRVAVNHSLNYRRKHQDEREESAGETDPQPVAGESTTAEAGAMREQMTAQVHRALLALKPKLRMIVILKDIEGLSYEEIAQRANCSTGTVASRLNRSRKLLARKLEHLRGAY
jgi:RNA polymerase sigma-70 factor (ECF subfamily)